MLLRLSSIYFTYMVEILYNRVLLRISSQLHIQLYHIGSLKLVMTGVLTLWKWVNIANQGCPGLLLNIYQHTTVLRPQRDRIIGNYSALPGTSLVVQWLRPGLIPDPETKILHAAWPENK